MLSRMGSQLVVLLFDELVEGDDLVGLLHRRQKGLGMATGKVKV